ncbi:MAG: hypothetical protein ABR549_03905 [Mycobacteriales bacterium]
MFLLALSGVDGSGKSTFASALVDQLRRDAPDLAVARLWLRYSPRRTAPGALSSTVSAEHRGHPLKRSMLRLGLAPAWVRSNAALYRRQLQWQLGAAHGLDIVVADRFVLDFLVDQLASGALRVGDAAAVAATLPGADTAVQLDVDDDELVRRLKPGDDADRVLVQAGRYRQLAAALGIPALDTRDPEAVRGTVERVLAVAR